MLAFARFIDATVGEWTGQLFCWLIVPMVLTVTYEIIARYAFNAPTIWAYDVGYMLYSSHFMLGAAYTLYKRGHIRTDIFWEHWSARTQGLIDASLYLLFFFPGMIFIFLATFEEAHLSWSHREVAEASPWRPPIYPLKAVMPVTAALLIAQGVSEFLKSVHAALRNEWP